ncbi:FAD-binding oxidoreductase [uncultured Ferrovibrio sp.]|jgi:FAD/FMN-containing dehydrogenase|uniref:FAD-binding oxidoreductase n=1 Tax=uncultured Ferrovibrio sp. TaxID=1576913 RepID=UPI002617945B|nr:FAD-binding oxidoreductase [uncultured Ferrovibrio sp.]
MTAIPDQLAGIVGKDHVLTADADQQAYVVDWMKKYRGRALAVVRPGSTEEVASVLRFCSQQGVAVIPQGGNTGMAGGATPDMSGGQVILSLTRMNRIREIDPVGNTITADAGCVLATIQQAACEVGRFFPLSLGAEGSCTIGGNLATNAGGIAVLRYGNARELTLGLEVVLADGRIWDGLQALRKDNTGYDLRDLFIGSEGTLGVITGAVLKLYAAPSARATAMVALPNREAALELFTRLRSRAGDRLTAFEFMTRACVDLVLAHVAGAVSPFAAVPPAIVLMELSDTDAKADIASLLEEVLTESMEAGIATDAVVAQSSEQTKALWRIREGISEAQVRAGKTIKHDIALPIGRLAAFMDECEQAIEAVYPGLQFLVFGHLGDGNLHYNLQRAAHMDDGAFYALTGPLNAIVHDLVHRYRGSISAEHGIGQLRRDELPRYKSDVALQMMRDLKRLFDPAGILNPGKLLQT